MSYGPHTGQRPASMWQWPAFADITAKPDWQTFAFHQGNLGAGYPKPTRLLIKTRVPLKLPSFCYIGAPSFDNKGFYTGPLPMAKGMGSIRGRQSTGPFKTSGTEMWPAKMCQWIASMIMSSWASAATTASREVDPDAQETGDGGVGPDNRYASRKELESWWEVLDPREFATSQGGLAISMMEEGFALQADGPPLGGILRMVRTGTGCEKGYWRRPPREPEA